MSHFSIKNETAAELLEQVTKITGEGKTEAIISSLRLYRDRLMEHDDIEPVLDAIRQEVHASIKPEFVGHAPGKDEIEAELGMM